MADKKTFTLAHFSDLHLFSGRDLSVSELLNKRILGYLSWRLHRRTNHRKEVLAGLLHDLQRLETDHIAITGDLTHLGRAAEFSRTQELLDRLGSPSKVSVVPGNHDAYIAANWMQTYARWAPYMASDSDYGETFQILRPIFPCCASAAKSPSSGYPLPDRVHRFLQPARWERYKCKNSNTC
jgi:3',5'-cyclic AMP phosphodiesterase CpdA